MAVGKGSIKRAAKAVDAAAVETPAKEVVEAIVEKVPAKKPAAKKTPTKKPAAKKAPVKKAVVKKEEPAKNAAVGIGTELPTHLL